MFDCWNERWIAFDWQNFFVSSIKFDYRTQSNPIERLGSIGFDYRTFDYLRRAFTIVHLTFEFLEAERSHNIEKVIAERRI